MAQQFPKHRFTVDDFQRMHETGVIAPDSRLELIAGELYEMSPIGKLHAGCVAALTEMLRDLLQLAAIVWVQNPVQLDDYAAPQPDVALLKRRDDFYRRGLPRPDDVLLVIEVADTTIDYDRLIKIPGYAQAGIKEAWLVNIPAERIEVYAEPTAGEYKVVKLYQRNEELRAHTFANLSLDVNDVLG
ncbi:MAG: Uma2 family endonuclease [Acidobacteriota bacterium]|nr:Uma2 family endonuclease [Acidobacteriota bacterium]